MAKSCGWNEEERRLWVNTASGIGLETLLVDLGWVKWGMSDDGSIDEPTCHRTFGDLGEVVVGHPAAWRCAGEIAAEIDGRPRNKRASNRLIAGTTLTPVDVLGVPTYLRDDIRDVVEQRIERRAAASRENGKNGGRPENK
jgi:hypothetical protein